MSGLDIDRRRDVVLVIGTDGIDTAVDLTRKGFKRVIIAVPKCHLEQTHLTISANPCEIVTDPNAVAKYLLDLEEPIPHKCSIGKGSQSGFTPEQMDDLENAAQKTISNMVSNKLTLERFGDLWAHNAQENLDACLSLEDISTHKERWAGKPMVIVGAGPSLDNTIHQLSDVAPGTCIMATSHALGALEQAGIKPDYVMVLDAQDVRWHFFNNNECSRLDTITGVLGVTVHPRSFHLPFKDILVFDGNKDINQWVSDKRETPLTSLVAGGNVLTSAVKLGIEWGCSRICLIGSDLSYPNGRIYAQGTDGGATIELTDDRKQFTIHNGSESLQALATDAPRALTTLPAIQGGTLPTCGPFVLYHSYLVMVARQYPGLLYQCSEQGALIDGATHCPLSEAL